MFRLDFKSNPSLTIGAEIEIQLIDPKTGNLKPAGPDILKYVSKIKEANHLKSEIFQSMLEIESPICENAHQVSQSLRTTLDIAIQAAQEFDTHVMMAGTHPFANYTERLLTPASRYHSLVDRNKWITRRLQIFGLHVHLAMRDGEHAIAMNNALCHYLPIVLAMSASSPYWQGVDTGLASSRITFFEATPTGGHPCLLNTWGEFESLIEKMIASDSIRSLKDLWWDIRPNTEFGTVEVRIADCPPTIKEIEALVALVHTLAVMIDNELTAGRTFLPPPEWILRENKWRASRYGVHSDLIMDNSGKTIPFMDIWREVRRSTKSICETFKYEPQFQFLNTLVLNGPSYIRQRHHFKKSTEDVVRHLTAETLTDKPQWDTV